MICFPNAKINIGLNVTEKRPDGFHNLESIFYPIQWNDVLELIPSDTFQWSQSGLTIDGSIEDNLCVKAYNLLKEDHDIPPVKAHLHKVIPMGAGLGGGSSDAAFMLKLLNDQFKLGISNESLKEYCRQLGSDCAFFIDNKPVFAFDKGDQFEETKLDLSDHYIFCVAPNIHVGTAEAYSGIKPKFSDFDLRNIGALEMREWRTKVHNDFEPHIFDGHPILSEIKLKMYEFGASYVSMSGSGSAIYGIFKEKMRKRIMFKDYAYKWV